MRICSTQTQPAAWLANGPRRAKSLRLDRTEVVLAYEGADQESDRGSSGRAPEAALRGWEQRLQGSIARSFADGEAQREASGFEMFALTYSIQMEAW